jgi:hypothetical protein
MLLHEAAVTQALAYWQPDCMPKILTIDEQRGWMLMRDGGPRLREILKEDRELQHWERLLPSYVRLQIKAANRIPELLALGAPDRRLSILPELYEMILGDATTLGVGSSGGLSPEEVQQLRDFTPHVATLCEKLNMSGVPESIHHGDFHDGNIFLSDGKFIFIDWGDCSVTHPFFSMRTAYVSNEHTLGLEEDSPELDRLRDAYLLPWRKFGSQEELLATFELARRLSPICSALSWHHVVSNLELSLRENYGHAIPSLLQEFMDLNQDAFQ